MSYQYKVIVTRTGYRKLVLELEAENDIDMRMKAVVLAAQEEFDPEYSHEYEVDIHGRKRLATTQRKKDSE